MRPIGSEVRQNIVEILFVYGKLYGYQIYKIYVELFPQITLRLVYYHLKKGVSTKEFSIAEVKKMDGNFSWGSNTSNIIYELGPEAKAIGNQKIKEYKNSKE